MRESECREHAAARRALDEALLDQIGLDDFLECVARLAERRGHRLDSYRTAIVELRYNIEVAAIQLVESARIDVEPQQRLVGNAAGDRRRLVDQREIGDAT